MFNYKTAESRCRKGNEVIRRKDWPQTHSLKLWDNKLKGIVEVLRYDRSIKAYYGILTDEDKSSKDWIDPGE